MADPGHTTALTEMRHEDWLAEAVRRFGADPKKWRFLCPFCHNVASPQDFIDAGAPGERAARECIGRYVGAKNGLRFKEPVDDGKPCDWAAFGLMGTLGQGITVTEREGGANDTEVFPFDD